MTYYVNLNTGRVHKQKKGKDAPTCFNYPPYGDVDRDNIRPLRSATLTSALDAAGVIVRRERGRHIKINECRHCRNAGRL